MSNEDSTENVEPAITDTIPDNAAVETAAPSQESAPKLSKNARKKAARENALPRDPIFGGNPVQNNSGSAKPGNTSAKPFEFEKIIRLATTYEETVNGIVDKYLAARNVQAVEAHGNAAVIRGMRHSDLGNLTFYIHKGKNYEGTIGKALAFHIIVMSDGVATKLEAFIERHRGGVSFMGIVAIAFYLEFAIQQNAKIIEDIERRSREASAQTVNAVEVEAIKVEPAAE